MSSRQNQLSEEEVKQLEKLRESSQVEAQKRAAVILELNQGDSLRTVAQNSGFSRSTVDRWWKSWEAGGVQGLIPKHLWEAIKLEQKVIELEQKLKDAQEKEQQAQVNYKSLKAIRDLENQESQDASRDTLKTLQSLLSVIDEFDRAFENLPEDMGESSWVEGISMIQANFEKLLKRYQIEAIDPTAGAAFDPNFHQAIGTDDSDEVESGHIIETLRKGYQAGEIVLRDALVRVAR